MKVTVAGLIRMLESAPNQEAQVYVCQPRTWVKKQPDLKKTTILTVVLGDIQCYIETGDFY